MKTKRKVQKKKCRCDEFGGKNSKMGENDHFFCDGCSEEKTPICSAQTSPLTMEDWEKELR